MKSKLSMALLWSFIFILGGIGGWIGHCLYHDHMQAAAPVKTTPKAQEIMDKMAQELSLDEQQKADLKVIFDESRMRYRALNAQFRPQYETIRDDSDNKIRGMLHNDQKARFEAMLKKYRPAKKSSK
jgi:hypothetical protein